MKVAMANLMPNRPRTGGEAAVWASKLVFLLIGVASTVVFLGKLAFPFLSHSLPNLCKSVGPRHLFIAVNSIIIIVWKLHGVQHHHDDHQETNKSSPYSTGTLSLDSHDPLPPPELIVVDSPPSIHESPSEDEDLEIKKIILDKQVIGSDNNDKSSDPWPPPPDESSEDPLPENDTMDAMWKAIMGGGGTSPDKNQNLKKTDDTWDRSTDQAATATTPTATSTPTLARASAAAARRFRKSDTFREDVKVAPCRKEMRKSKTFRESSSSPSPAAVAVPAAAGWRGRDRLVIGQDELFNKVEAFIKMNYDQLRLQRQESEQRYVENNMVNAAY
ncbi:uncharacterized protein M6B38_338965 [Iris pallida]|uniref:DUF4408 domain-containing protein n=1 Tax=Iris pallida TaxID=29817 RepID=A0AAX6GYL9_IRIPA|nr:uncharacterized protein M6B38_338965 [Iris pallida]